MTKETRVVIGGVDTHKYVHVAAVIDERGKILETAQFPTSAMGYGELLAWMRGFGEVARVGIEGTGAYGAGLCRYFAAGGVEVVEVNRPNRTMRRQRGKSDTVDAEAAARATLNGEATVCPKAQSGIVESIRAVRVAFLSSRNSRTKVANQIRDLILTAPDQLRSALESLNTADRVARCVRFRITGDPAEPLEGTRLALRALARRYEFLTEELGELGETLDQLTARANPALCGAKGVGADVAAILLVAAGDNPERLRNEAAFAAMCGVSPIEASSGQTVRHRLNRSGNRQANHALWRIVMNRMTTDDATKTYIARRRTEGKSQRDAVRCLKRYVAREMYRHIVDPKAVPSALDLRARRKASGFSQREAAAALGVALVTVSRFEKEITRSTAFGLRYEEWLSSCGSHNQKEAA
jgi:transposase